MNVRQIMCPLIVSGLIAVSSGSDAAADDMAAASPLSRQIGDLSLRLGMETAGQIVWQKDPFWNLSATFAPTADYAPERYWWEGYVKPSLTAEYALDGVGKLYGGVSGLGSRTWRIDDFLEGNTGVFLFEDYYAGLKLTETGSPVTIDVSAGGQQYKIGSGMIISTGGANGFERGAMILGPRKAWAMAGLARVTAGDLSFDAFYLHPNEMASNDTHTEMAGGKLELALGNNEMVGLAAGTVLTSQAPYVQAPPGGNGAPTIIFDGRDGMDFVHGYARFNPIGSQAPGFWVGAEGVYETNARIDMRAWAGRLEVDNAFTQLPWSPVLSYSYTTFSGDDPDTAALERFDPLYYDGAHGTWATGGNASLTLINTNINAHRLSLVLTPTPQDILTFRYWHIRANELDSPLQFGQATRLVFNNGVPTLASGVPDAHLSDDFLAEYTRIVSQNIFVTAGFAMSFPGSGFEEITNGDARDWYGAYGNVVVTY